MKLIIFQHCWLSWSTCPQWVCPNSTSCCIANQWATSISGSNFAFSNCGCYIFWTNWTAQWMFAVEEYVWSGYWGLCFFDNSFFFFPTLFKTFLVLSHKIFPLWISDLKLWLQTEPDFDLDIKEDVEDECNKYGRVKQIYVDK